jgi:hypothetical protein
LASLGHTTPGDSYALILFDPTGLAAPAIAAGFGALAPTLGTLVPFIGASGFAAMAAAAGSVAGSVAVAASFGGWYKCSLETLMLLSYLELLFLHFVYVLGSLTVKICFKLATTASIIYGGYCIA